MLMAAISRYLERAPASRWENIPATKAEYLGRLRCVD